MWVVVTVSSPSWKVPVEKPSKVCSAYSDGCGRPSSHIVRSARPNMPTIFNAMSCSVAGSRISLIRMFGPSPRIAYTAGHACVARSGWERTEGSQLSAIWREAALMGSPS